MFGFTGRTEDLTERVKDAADKATFRNIPHAAFSLRKKAVASITKSKEPSEAGEPPHTRGRGRQNLKKAIFVGISQDKESAVIGPRESWVGESGEAHEFGEEYKGDPFEERPFMEPALAESVDRFASDWKGSIGE